MRTRSEDSACCSIQCHETESVHFLLISNIAFNLKAFFSVICPYCDLALTHQFINQEKQLLFFLTHQKYLFHLLMYRLTT